MLDPEILGVTYFVAGALDSLDVEYALGGSLAAAAHGYVRNTNDADIVANLQIEHINEFVEILGSDFYADRFMIHDAVVARRSFNIIHLATMFKVDIFVTTQRRFDQLQLERRLYEPIEEGAPLLYVATAEDTILAKLNWFRMTGEQSERQWRDVLEIMKVQRGKLDKNYMLETAPLLEVADLVQRAFNAAEET